MRKYWRLLLVIIAILSCVMTIIYRQKYYKVYTFHELLYSFRGEKCNQKPEISQHINYTVKEQIYHSGNQWFQIFDNVYFYTSHLISNEVYTLVITKDMRHIQGVRCNFLFEDNTPSDGVFKMNVLRRQKTHLLLYTTCKLKLSKTIPYAVRFSKNNISSVVELHQQKYNFGQFTACVSPLSSPFSDRYQITEFLAYHSLIGIKHFILYYTVMTSSIKGMIYSIAIDCGVSVELLPWHHFSDFMNIEPSFVDCLLHVVSRGHSEFIMKLKVDEFIVPNDQIGLNELDSALSIKHDKLALKKIFFCSELENNIIADNLNIKLKTLLKTKSLQEKESQNSYVIFNVNKIKLLLLQDIFHTWLTHQKKHIPGTSSLAVYSYSKCKPFIVKNDTQLSYVENYKMWNYKADIFNSCVYTQIKNTNFIS